MKIAVVQMKCDVADVAANVNKIVDFIEQAAARGGEAVVFPEMADTGYEMEAVRRHACAWSRGPFTRIRQAARENNIFVVCGLSEREPGKIYNTVAVVDPDGELAGKYRKTHLAAFSPLDEDKTFAAGDSLETIRIKGMKLGLMICYDLRFPEAARTLALKGAEVLVLCSAWPFPRLRHWETLIRARAIENQVFLVASNHVGSNGKVVFCGSSRIVDPFGTTTAAASEESETLIFGDIDQKKVRSVRNAMPVFEHRRDNIYRP